MGLIETLNDEYVLYVLGSEKNIQNFCMNPFGINAYHINPLLMSSKTFVDLLIQLDGLSYGNKNLGMEKWVALDCGMLPSAFVGLAKKVPCLDNKLKEKFFIPENYKGLVPLTMYCAIPSAEEGVWISHSLASIEQGKGLGLLTKVLGIKLYGAKSLRGIAQYNNNSVKIHTKISNLKLISALTFAHSIPEMTFVYEHEVDENKLINAISGVSNIQKPSFLLKTDDYETKLKMQEEIEANTADFFVISPGQIIKEEEIYVPILKINK